MTQPVFHFVGEPLVFHKFFEDMLGAVWHNLSSAIAGVCLMPGGPYSYRPCLGFQSHSTATLKTPFSTQIDLANDTYTNVLLNKLKYLVALQGQGEGWSPSLHHGLSKARTLSKAGVPLEADCGALDLVRLKWKHTARKDLVYLIGVLSCLGLLHLWFCL